MIVPCDCLVVSGTAILQEEEITGETHPITKNKNINTIFCGSKVITTKECVAIVTNIGFLTFKGRLIRSIVYPAKIKMKF